MFSFAEVWSRSLDFWVTALLKDIQRNHTKAIVRLLATLSHRRGFDAFAQALIHCRGDRQDSLICLLKKLCLLSRTCSDSFTSEGHVVPSDTEKPTSGHREEQQRTPTTTRSLSRSILAAITPLLLHIFLSRRKNPLKSQHLSHCYSAILRDVGPFIKGTDDQPDDTVAFFGRGKKCSRKSGRCKSRSHTFSLVGRKSVDHAILKCSTKLLLSKVDLERNQSTTAVVQAIKEADVDKSHPIDNVSGIQDVLLSICNSFNLEASENIPCSLFQLYEELPASQHAVRNRVENALVYIQRLRNLDLEFRFSHNHILREATKANTLLCQYLENRTGCRPRSYKRWYNLHRRRRSSGRRCRLIKRNVPQDVPSSSKEIADSHSNLHDGHVASILGRCLLFCSENISGFVKICRVMRGIRRDVASCASERLLLIASSAIQHHNHQFMTDDKSFSNRFPPPLMVYYTFMSVIESICSDSLSPITPMAMYPSRGNAIDWIIKDVSCKATKESSESKTLQSKLDDSVTTSDLTTPRKSEQPNSRGKTTTSIVDGRVSIDDRKLKGKTSMLLANRDAILKPLSSRIGRRIYLSENMALCILRAHAIVFKIYFDNLRGAFQDMENEFTTLYRDKNVARESQTNAKSFELFLEDVFSRKELSTPTSSHRSFRRLMLPYSLHAYTSFVLGKFTLRMTNEMFPRAFWLSSNHMKLLGQRVRGSVTDVYV